MRPGSVFRFVSHYIQRVKRARLILPQEYISALEEVLDIPLSEEFVRTREGKKQLEKIATSVEEVSKGLTTGRDQFLARKYLKDTQIRKAYALYYTTTNILKPFIPLKELFIKRDLTTPLYALDLGAGTGAAALGLLHFLHQSDFKSEVHLTLVDAVEQNLADATTIINAYAKSLPYTVTIATRTKNIADRDLSFTKQFDFIMMMNTLNELDVSGDQQLLRMFTSSLRPDGAMLLIEPAARPSSRRLLEFRDIAVDGDFTVYAPCTRQAGCPALLDEGDWCHTEVSWERPAFIKYIDDLIGTLRLSLKYSYVILNRNGQTLHDRLGHQSLSRVVSEVLDEKGRIRFFLCDPLGRVEHIANKRDISELNADVRQLERYDLIQIDNIEPREHDTRITEASKVVLVLPSSGARY